jgi:hypothetical protein
VSEGWRLRIGSFEKVNAGLQTSLAELRQENDDLKHQVRARSGFNVTIFQNNFWRKSAALFPMPLNILLQIFSGEMFVTN